MRDFFFKYSDQPAAEAVLKNKSFRYSSPLNFNDPFDIQTDVCSAFDRRNFSEDVMNIIEREIRSNAPLPNLEDSPVGRIVSVLREQSKTRKYRKYQLREILFPHLGKLCDAINQAILRWNSNWRKSMEKSRVFCVTEKNDNLLMWAHYAGDHSGVVFQIASLPERNTRLLSAKKVIYAKTPILFEREEFVAFILTGIEPDMSKFNYANYAHHKSDIWNYEDEWRVVFECDHLKNEELHVDHPFVPEQLHKIFFGCKSNIEYRNYLIRMAKKINPKTEFFLAKKRKAEYALDFTQI